MAPTDTDTVRLFAIFGGIWAALGIGAVAFFLFSRNAALKRKVWPWVAPIAGLLFIALVWLIGVPTSVLLFIIVGVAAVTWANLRMTRFCSGCGAAVIDPVSSARAVSCPRCGQKLGD